MSGLLQHPLLYRLPLNVARNHGGADKWRPRAGRKLSTNSRCWMMPGALCESHCSQVASHIAARAVEATIPWSLKQLERDKFLLFNNLRQHASRPAMEVVGGDEGGLSV